MVVCEWSEYFMIEIFGLYVAFELDTSGGVSSLKFPMEEEAEQEVQFPRNADANVSTEIEAQ